MDIREHGQAATGVTHSDVLWMAVLAYLRHGTCASLAHQASVSVSEVRHFAATARQADPGTMDLLGLALGYPNRRRS